ncbi:10056_t:CDS:1, partial [Acaulospora morrowiae]
TIVTKNTNIKEAPQSQEMIDTKEESDIKQPYTKTDKGKNIINQEYSFIDKDQSIKKKDTTTTKHIRLAKSL